MKFSQHVAYILGAVMIGVGIGLGLSQVKERKINKEARKIERETR